MVHRGEHDTAHDNESLMSINITLIYDLLIFYYFFLIDRLKHLLTVILTMLLTGTVQINSAEYEYTLKAEYRALNDGALRPKYEMLLARRGRATFSYKTSQHIGSYVIMIDELLKFIKLAFMLLEVN